jgi:glutamate/tyrosine decarboxylase-like PLP-dependent enzyme
MFFCRHRDSVAQAFRSDVNYMPSKPNTSGTDAFPTFDPLTNSAQWSRRFIGLKLFMALAQHGEAGYADMIDNQTRMGQFLRQSLVESGWCIVNSTPLPVVCFTRDGLNPSAFLADLRDQKIAWMSEARLGGSPIVRACITSYRTTEKDIACVVNEMNRLFSDSACREPASVAR